MANLKLSLGLIPATLKIEQAEADLIKEFEKLQAFTDSDELAKYNELDTLINSTDFQAKKKEIVGHHFKHSEEFNKENEFKKLGKSKDISVYFKIKDSDRLKKFNELDGSDAISRYDELHGIVDSPAFKQKQKSKEFKGSEDEKMAGEYRNLKARSDIKAYFKFKKSKDLANFRQAEGSSRLARYEELKTYLTSDEFKERKEYLLDKKRFEKTDLFVKEQEYEKLKKSDDISWYFKVKDSDKFDILKHRDMTFSDEFEGEGLDSRKWLTNHYWGDKLLNDRYSLESDLHCYTESENFEARNSILKIITKPQKAEGKVWNPELGGFRMKNFDFTSGIINSGKTFRQKYGIFKAKVKLNTAPGPRHAFYLLADKITPHIDICRTGKGKVWMDLYDNGTKANTSIGSRYSKDYHIFTLEWTSDKLVWKINDFEVYKQTRNVPQEEMYINFSGGLDKAIAGSSAMEIDWVRVYQWK